MKIDISHIQEQLRVVVRKLFKYRTVLSIALVSSLLLYTLFEVNSIYSSGNNQIDDLEAMAEIKKKQIEFDIEIINEIKSRINDTGDANGQPVNPSPFDPPRSN